MNVLAELTRLELKDLVELKKAEAEAWVGTSSPTKEVLQTFFQKGVNILGVRGALISIKLGDTRVNIESGPNQ
jgi:hypothetical protein